MHKLFKIHYHAKWSFGNYFSIFQTPQILTQMNSTNINKFSITWNKKGMKIKELKNFNKKYQIGEGMMLEHKEHKNSTNKVDATTWPLPQARDLGEVLTTIGGRRQKRTPVKPKQKLVGANNKHQCRGQEMKANDVEEKKKNNQM